MKAKRKSQRLHIADAGFFYISAIFIGLVHAAHDELQTVS